VRSQYRFTVREDPVGSPRIDLEPAGAVLPVLGNGVIGFALRVGTTTDEAQQLAAALNSMVAEMTYTHDEPS